jgi:RNA polymerase sigma-70 factor (ECF subfamily)
MALRKLSNPHQQVITLCVFEGLSIEDVARVLEVRPGTVKSRLSRAKARLREELAEHPHLARLEGAADVS